MKSRWLEILQILINQQNYSITISEIAQRFSVTERTIRSDIKSINEYLLKNDMEALQINRSRIVVNFSNDEIRKLENLNSSIDYYSNSQLRILDLILSFTFGKVEYIYNKQEEFQVSKSTMDGDLKVVREILEKYHLSLNNPSNKYIEILGDERAIRVMVFNVINKIIGVVDIFNDFKNQTAERKILFKYIPFESFEKMNEIYSQSIMSENDMMYKNQTILYLLIWVYRIKNGYQLQSEFNDDERIDVKLDELCGKIAKQFDITLSTAEKHYIKLISETLDSESLNESSNWSKGQILTLDLIEFVQTKMNIEFDRKDELFAGLFKHIIKLINRVENNIQIVNPLTDEIKGNNEKLFNSIQSFEGHEDNHFNKMTDDEIAYLAIYFLVSLSKNRQKNTFVFYAVVFCNYGKATSQLIAHMLEENFNIKVIATLSTNEISLINKLDVDIAFSTVNLHLDSIPLLIIDSVLIRENNGKIQKFLEDHDNLKRQIESNESKQHNHELFNDIIQLIRQSKGQINESTYQDLTEIFKKNNLELDPERTLPSLRDVLREENVLFNLKAKDWRDAIRKTANPLLEERFVSSHYVDSMLTAVKVNGPYIVIASNIALAHSRPTNGVNQLGLSVSKLVDPIKFGHESYDPIKIIFCLAPIDSYTHINIMKSIFNLVNNNNKLQALLQSESKEEFKSILRMEGED
ncbi:BglG family transcription antiterminator [Fundicoccus sp. Sow4_H7]|uniref:BglG family transcription antiterminator n=1 Tax=Fundicoccus sp. Sow4_H7 TaxID=3438784 RepID=UPI003F8E8693